MSEEQLRELIETNFRLLAVGMREASVRAGGMERGLGEVRGGLGEVRRGLDEVRNGLDQVRGDMDHVRDELEGVRALAEANRDGFAAMADTTEATLEAIKTLAFGGVGSKQKIASLEDQMGSVPERLDRLEEAS